MATATVEPMPPKKQAPNSIRIEIERKPKGEEYKSWTLTQKIADACSAVGGIEKKGRNQKQDYNYVMAADVAAAFRHELFDRGVVLLQDEESAEFTQYETRGGGMMQECRLKIKFTLKDDSQEIAMSAFGVGRDTFDKAIYKAKTGATKYFLRGLGLVPDRADDPEDDKTEQEVVSNERPKNQPVPLTPNYPPHRPSVPDVPSQPVGSLAPFQKTGILNACKKSGKNSQQLNDFLHKTFGYDQLDQMPKKDFQQALKWAMEG